MTYPHADQAHGGEAGEFAGMVNWTCPECPRNVYAAADNPPQRPCAELPWHACQSESIERRACEE